MNIIILSSSEIAGYYKNLHKGFLHHGQNAHLYIMRPHPFGYSKPKSVSWLEKSLSWFAETFIPASASRWQKIFAAPFYYCLSCILFIHYLFNYDIFIYSSGYQLLPFHLDRKILFLFDKKIIEVFTGSDSRPAYLNGKNANLAISELFRITRKQNRFIKRLSKTATAIIDSEPCGHFHTKPFINFLHIGCPFDYTTANNRKHHQDSAQPPLIIHAPSHKATKGTDIIRTTLSKISTENPSLNFEYKELSNIPHETVMEYLEQCFLVINEFYSDTLMSVLDTEAAWHKKPSIVGGYDLKALNIKMGEKAPPTYIIEPDQQALEEAILYLLNNPNQARAIGQQAFHFVEQEWSPPQVAQKYMKIISGNIPTAWICNPQKIQFHHGYGITRKQLRHTLNQIITTYGETILCLDDKPQVKEQILNRFYR